MSGGIRSEYAPLDSTMLDESLPDGSYFERRGSAAIGGRRIEVRATGARTMVGNVYFVHRGAAFGEAAGNGKAQPARATGDNRNAGLFLSAHAGTLLWPP